MELDLRIFIPVVGSCIVATVSLIVGFANLINTWKLQQNTYKYDRLKKQLDTLTEVRNFTIDFEKTYRSLSWDSMRVPHELTSLSYVLKKHKFTLESLDIYSSLVTCEKTGISFEDNMFGFLRDVDVYHHIILSLAILDNKIKEKEVEIYKIFNY